MVDIRWIRLAEVLRTRTVMLVWVRSQVYDCFCSRLTQVVKETGT